MKELIDRGRAATCQLFMLGTLVIFGSGCPSRVESPTVATLHRQLVADVTANYTWGDYRGVIGDTAQVRRVEIGTAIRQGAPAPGGRGRVIARIRSTDGYPRLGLASGVNYVWRDSASGPSLGSTRMLVVPERLDRPMKWLLVAMTSAPADSSQPLLMWVGPRLLQYCDPECSMGHCTSSDTIGSVSPWCPGCPP